MNWLDGPLRVTRAYLQPAVPGWRWDNRSPHIGPWQDLDLWVCFDGRGTLDAPHGEYPIRRGSCFVLRHWEHYCSRQEDAAPVTHLYVHFDVLDETGNAVPPERLDLPPFHRVLDDLELVEGLANRLAEACRLTPRFDPYHAQWLRPLLMEIDRQDRRPRLAGASLAQLRQVEEIAGRIHSQPGWSWRVADLAREVNCTPDTLTRRFRRFLGRSPQEVIQVARLEAAKHLLATTPLAIAEVAEQLGYCDVQHFSKSFRHHTGMPPHRWRHQADNP